jgi:group II intron reverse transcriptase/maturase
VAKLLNWGCTEVYDVDLSKYFDTVDHVKLMKLLARRIVDKQILQVIKQWLDCGYFEGGTRHRTRQGTPQGGVISPLLANIYLHPLDRAMDASKLWKRRKGSVHMVRYADDFLLLANRNLEAGQRIVEHYLNRLGLRINGEKTREHSIGESGTLEFLGFRFVRTINRKKGNRFFLVTPSALSMRKVREKLRRCISTFNPITVREQVAQANVKVRGWVNYFGLGHASQAIRAVRDYEVKRIRSVLQRRKGNRGHGWKRYDSDYIYGKLGLHYRYRIQPI